MTTADLVVWLDEIRARFEGELVRAKGLVATLDQSLVLVQIVGRRVEITLVPEPERHAPTDLVAIFLPRPE